MGAELFYVTKSKNLRLDEFCAVATVPIIRIDEENKNKGIEEKTKREIYFDAKMHPCAANKDTQLWEYTELVRVFISCFNKKQRIQNIVVPK